MPASILSSILSTPKLTITDDRTGAARWTKLKVKKVEIGTAADQSVNPISDSQINDTGTYRLLLEEDIKQSKIVRPTRIRIEAYVPDISTMSSILQAFNDTTTTFKVTSKSIITDSMVLVHVDVDQRPEHLSAYAVNLEFEQAIPPAIDTTYDPAQDADAPEVGTRVQAPQGVDQTISGLYNRALGSVQGLTNLF